MNSMVTNFDYLKVWWGKLPALRKRRWKIFLTVLLVLWILGTGLAYTHIEALVIMGQSSRLLSATVVGPWGTVWWLLEAVDIIQEKTGEPNLLWLLFDGIQCGFIWLVIQILTGEANPRVQQEMEM